MCSSGHDPDSRLRNEFTAYVSVVLRRAKVDYLRIYIRKTSREELFDTLPEHLLMGGNLGVPDVASFCNKRLDLAFDALPTARQKILTCFFVHEMTAREIAGIYGYSEKYVYKLKYSSLELLRKYIQFGIPGGDERE